MEPVCEISQGMEGGWVVIEASHVMGYGLNVTFNVLNTICCKQLNILWYLVVVVMDCSSYGGAKNEIMNLEVLTPSYLV